MKPDGIHFESGTVKGLPFPIFLDLSDPESKWYMAWRGIFEPPALALPGKKYPGRINYKIHNYCARCKIKYPKGTYRCKNCSGKCRTKPWASNYNRKKKVG